MLPEIRSHYTMQLKIAGTAIQFTILFCAVMIASYTLYSGSSARINTGLPYAPGINERRWIPATD